MSKISDKAVFISALRRFAEDGGDELWDPVYSRKGYRAHRGEQALALGIAKYLDEPDVPGDTIGINWYHDLHSHLVDVHVGGLHRLLVVNQLAYLATVLSGEEWLQSKLEAYFNAQQACIDQAWEGFVRVGYRQLMPRIKKEGHRGNKGTFGATTLMTYAIAGRVMFTFQRDKSSVTYVADDSDMHGERSGPNGTATPYVECVSMINEVSDNWDMTKMTPDDKIGIG